LGFAAEVSGEAVKARLPTVLVLLAIVAAAIFLRSQHMTDVMTRSPDERTYTAYAARLADEGFGVYRELLAAYDRNPDQWIYPSPTRFGNVLLAAGVMQVTGVRDGRAGAATSWLFSIFSVALVAWMGLRFFHPCVALFAAALMACSFGELGMARRAWQDTLFGFCALLMIYLACEIGRRPEKKLLYVALFAVGAFSLLTKESSVLAYGLVLLWLAGSALWESSWRRAAWVVATGAGSLTVALAVWILLAGDVGIALASVDHSTRSGAGAWAQQYCSGPWYQFPYLLWITGPLTAVAALAGAGAALSFRAPIADHRAAGLAAFFTLGFVSFASFFPNLQYLRIISPAGGSYCLLAGLGLWFPLSVIRAFIASGSLPRFAQHAAAVAAGAAVLAAGLYDYQSFTDVVVRSGMEELSVYGIRLLMHK
jgi:4-amino-4-deoxy-L-arabinose transferase-like glycosyltransferase